MIPDVVSCSLEIDLEWPKNDFYVVWAWSIAMAERENKSVSARCGRLVPSRTLHGSTSFFCFVFVMKVITPVLFSRNMISVPLTLILCRYFLLTTNQTCAFRKKFVFLAIPPFRGVCPYDSLGPVQIIVPLVPLAQLPTHPAQYDLDFRTLDAGEMGSRWGGILLHG